MTNYLLYLLAIFSLSQASILIKWSGMPPDILGFWRLFIAALILIFFQVYISRSFAFYIHLKKNIKHSLIAGLIFFAHLWTYFYAAQNTSISRCMIIFALNPIYTSIGASLFFKEKNQRHLWFSFVIAFIGIIFLTHFKLPSQHEASAWGDLGALISGLFYSGYVLAAKKSRRLLGTIDFSIGLYLTAALFFYFTVIIRGTPFVGYSNQAWIGLLGTIIFPTFLGHSLFNYLLNFLNINWMSCGKLLEPSMSSFVAFLVFNEHLNIGSYIAFGCTSLAVFNLLFCFSRTNTGWKIISRIKD